MKAEINLKKFIRKPNIPKSSNTSFEHLKKLWFQSIRNSDKSVHIIGFNLVLKGDIKYFDLKNAFENTLKKYEVFSYSYLFEDEQIVTSINDKIKYFWNFLDFSDRSVSMQEIRELDLRSSSTIVSLEQQIYICAILYKLSSNEYILSVSFHHLYCDSHSLKIISTDLMYEWKKELTKKNTLKEYSLVNTVNNPVENGKIKVICQVDIFDCNKKDKKQIKSNEKIFKIESTKYSILKELCKTKSITVFSLITACCYVLNTTSFYTTKSNIGILFTIRTKDSFSSVGCFVQALQINISIDFSKAIFDLAKQIKDSCLIIASKIKRNESVDESGDFDVMISMVKETTNQLEPPDGIEIQYLRRLHTIPEKNLHIYIYQYRDHLEIVFNYNPNYYDKKEVENLRNQLKKIIYCVLEGEIQILSLLTKIPSDVEMLKLNDVKFNHLGYAVWESDIGIARMKLKGASVEINKTIDKSMGVEMTMMKMKDGLNIELIAPLSERAPCVSFLEHNDEAPYHICWEINYIEAIEYVLIKNKIKFNQIIRDEKSNLFPERKVYFYFVDGIGLIEFITRLDTSEVPKNEINISKQWLIKIDSRNIINASNFLKTIGFSTHKSNPLLFINEDISIELETPKIKGNERIIFSS